MQIMLLIMGGVYALVFLWIGYLAVMNLKLHFKELTIYTKVLAYPLIIAFAVCDALVSILLASVLFLDWPREFLLTDRLIRLKNTRPDNWRGQLACFICRHFLDQFDPAGVHCS